LPRGVCYHPHRLEELFFGFKPSRLDATPVVYVLWFYAIGKGQLFNDRFFRQKLPLRYERTHKISLAGSCELIPVLYLRSTLHYSGPVQGLFASDIEHFGSQADAEGCVKNHRLSEGRKARVSVI
jgi:hypothetical protein